MALGRAARLWFALAAADGFMAVAAGAFAAHGVANPQVKAWLQTGAQYQLVHAVAAVACFGLAPAWLAKARAAAALFGAGGLVFGGSLYLLALTGVRLWGAVTPIGGLLMLAGWATLAWAALSRPPAI